MYVRSIELKNFRNIENAKLELNNNVNIFIGNNAQGKTNLLESIFVTSIGRSFRTKHDKDLIQFGQDYAFIRVEVADIDAYDKIEYYTDNIGRKKITMNNTVIRKNGDILGVLLTVSFTPQDLNLITDGPSERRRFLDIELCQLSQQYFHNLKQYNKVLKSRNNLLKTIQRDCKQVDQLDIWDIQLIEYGNKIYKERKKFIEKIEGYANELHSSITEQKENLKILYKSNFTPDSFENKLIKNRQRDVIFGHTAIGPHKDDLEFLINNIDVKNFGSQGQKRTASLSTKLAEIQLIKNIKNKTPILLLDDVLSELDKTRQNFLINKIKDIQVILTCTGVEDFINCFSEDTTIFYVENGIIKSK